MIQNKILVIIPAYNEEESIRKVVKQIFSLNLSLSVLVVNDGSEDKTAQYAKEAHATVISHPFNLGVGGAVQTGFIYAKVKGFDLVARIDADGQHDVSYLEELIKPILNNDADMTIGSRFLQPFSCYSSSFARRIGINFFSSLIGALVDYKITDSTSGFCAYNGKMIEVFSNYYPQDFPEPEAIVVAGRYKARIKEVAVQMKQRDFGISSIRHLKTLYFMIKVTFAILLDKLKVKRIR